MKFNERLISAMDRLGIKQIELANRTGIAPGTLSNYMQGKYKAKGENLRKIADALNVNPAWLDGLDAPMEIKKTNIIDLGHKLETWEQDYYSQDIPTIERDEEVTREELDLLTAYRDAGPAIRAAVRKLLDIPEESK